MPNLLNPPYPDAMQSLGWSNLHGSALALAIAETARTWRGMLVVVLQDPHQLHILANELNFFMGRALPNATPDEADTPLLILPGWECLPYDIFSPHQDIISQRLRILSRLPDLTRAILLVTCDNLMQHLPPLEYVIGHSFSLQKEQSINLKMLREKLSNANYVAVQQVMAPGEFALRGGLVDIFPMGSITPFRLELLYDEIETIRHFDVDSQRSNRQVEQISLLPAREFPMTESAIKRFRQAFREHFAGDPRTQKIYTEISNHNITAGAEFFFPLFFDKTCTLFDYIRGDALWLVQEQFAHTAKTYWAELEERYHQAHYDRARKVLPPHMLYLTPHELQQHLHKQRQIFHYPTTKPNSNSVSAKVALPKPDHENDLVMWSAGNAINPQYPVDSRKESPYQHLLEHLSTSKTRCLLTVETAGRREALQSTLSNHQFSAISCASFGEFLNATEISLGICVYPLERGLSLPQHNIQIITESQLYGEKALHQRRTVKAQDPEAIIRSLAELHEGSPVVHIEHGVGRYRGLKFLDIDGQQTEFLMLEYHGGGKLYVPVLSLNLISRFIGGSPEHAPLHRLGGEQWQKSKKRARIKAYDVAAELLEVEALRNARTGHTFTVPSAQYESFVSRFPFVETTDQQRTIEEVRADLASPQPMDRLVCGDVGFGKTEVALRAAFIVAHSNFQVAILVPTTLLAQQHYQTFVDRFVDTPISIEVLSRFKTKKQAAALVAKLKQGYPDIIIGTHRLLQNDIGFKRLGLLIIDEEHRFGVRQKEKIKQLRSQVDILNLTATPIPRTLNITMSGLRSISLITTAPQLRLSIKTFIRESSRGLIREACLREIRRGGQVYFLYNDVRNMQYFTAELAELVPEANINFAHGQLSELRLEQIMQDFYYQRFNVLVCSTIIESGLDIPSANTIIIHRADHFGLAQLHQLRGRVGRSHHQAFAYLLIANWQLLSSNAKKRLAAFELMDELGAGFALASHDLEIRGAGELLGETQSGLIDDVGFTLYNEYLSMAVAALRTPNNHQTAYAAASRQTTATEINLHATALLPSDYLANPQMRLTLYKRIAGAADAHELEEIHIEVVDRFGLLPQPGKNLFRLTALRLQAEQLGIRKIDVGAHGGSLEFTEKSGVELSVILALVQRKPERYRLAGPNTLKVTWEVSDPLARLAKSEKLLSQLSRKLAE